MLENEMCLNENATDRNSEVTFFLHVWLLCLQSSTVSILPLAISQYISSEESAI